MYLGRSWRYSFEHRQSAHRIQYCRHALLPASRPPRFIGDSADDEWDAVDAADLLSVRGQAHNRRNSPADGLHIHRTKSEDSQEEIQFISNLITPFATPPLANDTRKS